jgi:hypothetical protein
MPYFQLLFTTFILFGHEVKGSFLLHKWVDWIMYLIYIDTIDRLIKKVTPYIFFYIVIVLTHRAMFYLAKKKDKIEIIFWRDGRVVDGSGLENRYSS